MIATTAREENYIHSSLSVPESSKETLWQKLVKQQVKDGTLKCPTCKVYSTKSDNNTVAKETRCVCGRLARRHSYTDDPETKYQKSQKWRPNFTAIVDVTTYGQRKNGARVYYHSGAQSNIRMCFRF